MSEGFIIGNGGGGIAFGYIAALVPTDAESLVCRMYANEQRTQLIGSIDGGEGIEAGQFLFKIPVRSWCTVTTARTLAGGAEETKTVNVNVLTRGKIERALLGWKTWLYITGDSETFALWQKSADDDSRISGQPRIPDNLINQADGMKIVVNKSSSVDIPNSGGISLLQKIDLSNYRTLRFNLQEKSATVFNGEYIKISDTDPHAGSYRSIQYGIGDRDLDISDISGEKYIMISLHSYADSTRNYCIVKEVYLE